MSRQTSRVEAVVAQHRAWGVRKVWATLKRAGMRVGRRRLPGHPRNVPDGAALRSDHGPVYTGADAHAFALRRGVEQTFAPVGRPTGNAVAERTIRTMKEVCVWLEDWRNARDLRNALAAWWRSVNEARPHPSLNWLTPAEYRSQRLGPGPERAAA